jgi:inhibitor-of-growth protein 1
LKQRQSARQLAPSSNKRFSDPDEEYEETISRKQVNNDLSDISSDEGSAHTPVNQNSGKAEASANQTSEQNEPLYCTCQQVSYGQMILCDNHACSLEWFHFDCVDLQSKPKGKWYCPNCRGDTHKVMKKNNQNSTTSRNNK